ncbi:MAG: hypothetical protein ACOYJA_09835 [Christensenellales bacterium]|jgi:uncharacterized protein YxjI
MELWLKQHAYSNSDRYIALDDHGHVRFTARAMGSREAPVLQLADALGRDQVRAARFGSRFFPRYNLLRGEEVLLRARCGMSLFRITFTLDGGYRFEGNVAKPRFNLTQAGRRLMTVERQGDRREGNYRLSIADGQDEALLCALVMTLDNALQRAAFA